jgi:hypothetical protein
MGAPFSETLTVAVAVGLLPLSNPVFGFKLSPPSFQSTDRRAKQAHDLLEGSPLFLWHFFAGFYEHESDLIERHFHQ